MVYHKPLLVEKCRRRAYGGTIKCIVTHPLDPPLASHPRYLGLYEIWNIWLLLSLLCTTKWMLYGNIHDYKLLWKRNRWSFNYVIHMEKNCKWLSKTACYMLTINPMQADKMIYMTIYIYIWFYIKTLINCQENKGFQMLWVDCFRPFVPFSTTFMVIWLCCLQSQMVRCACGMFCCIWWMYWYCLPIFVLFPVLHVPHH